MKRRVVGVITAVMLAAVGTLVLVAYVNAAEDRALAGEKLVDVLVVAKAIDKGTPASEVKGSVRTERVPAKVRAEDAVADLADLKDRVAAIRLSPGEQLIAGRFVDKADLELVGQVQVPDGLLQVTVALSPERTVGGRIQAGASVGVLASFEPFELSNEQPVVLDGVTIKADGKTPNSTHFIKHKALVTAVQGDVVASDSDDPNQSPDGNLLVTLALTAPEVERLVFTAEYGSIWLAFEPEDAPESGTQVITRGEVYPA